MRKISINFVDVIFALAILAIAFKGQWLPAICAILCRILAELMRINERLSTPSHTTNKENG